MSPFVERHLPRHPDGVVVDRSDGDAGLIGHRVNGDELAVERHELGLSRPHLERPLRVPSQGLAEDVDQVGRDRDGVVGATSGGAGDGHLAARDSDPHTAYGRFGGDRGGVEPFGVDRVVELHGERGAGPAGSAVITLLSGDLERFKGSTAVGAGLGAGSGTFGRGGAGTDRKLQRGGCGQRVDRAEGDPATIEGCVHCPGCLLVVDNTVATPLVQRPLELGADLVVHSATKFLGGHSDLLAGVVVATDEDAAAPLRRHRTLTGANLGALEAFLLTRGIRTLALRVERGTQSAIELTARLRDDPRIATVRHPGVTALLSFDVVGNAADTEAFLTRLRIVHHATSLGGVETTAERRAGHAGQEHLPETLVRMSVGCEDVVDLWQDLDRALGPLPTADMRQT